MAAACGVRIDPGQWRRRAESNRCTRFCRPLPSHSATSPSGSSRWESLKRRQTGAPDRDKKPRKRLERMKGFEPSTFCMASRRSSQLSYIRPDAVAIIAKPGADSRVGAPAMVIFSCCRRPATRYASAAAAARTLPIFSGTEDIRRTGRRGR